MNEPKLNTFVIPVIRDDLIERCLETIYKYTEPDTFYVYIVDQTPRGLPIEKLRAQYKNLMIIRTPRTATHHAGNLGFAKANNLAVQLVETPYFTMCNDDVEFIGPWWKGVIDTFKMINRPHPDADLMGQPKPCMSVTLASVKLPDWSVGRPAGDDFYILPYKENYTQAEYDWLVNEEHYVNEHLTIRPGSVIDGVTLYCSVFDTRKFLEVGMLDERFYPGAGEDYDLCCRASMYNYRMVGTTLSWVFHHWSKSIGDEMRAEIEKTQDPELRWNNNNEKWGEGFDIWGDKTKTKDQIPPNTIIPL